MKELSFLERLEVLSEDELNLIEESIQWERHWRYLQQFPTEFCDAVFRAVKDKKFDGIVPYLNAYNEVSFRLCPPPKIKPGDISKVFIQKSMSGYRRLHVFYKEGGFERTFELSHLSDPERHRRFWESRIVKDLGEENELF